jgi:V/A-type H+-transporting ATPase subunit E
MSMSADKKQADGKAVPTASGVEQLIQRLRKEGVEAGQNQASELAQAAEQKANAMLEEARSEAEKIVAEARQEADKLQASGEDALRVAARDTILRMREELTQYLRTRVKRLVSEQLVDSEMLRRLILEVASRALGESSIDQAKQIEVLLPGEVVGLEELRRRPEELEGRLGQLVRQIASATWREGIAFNEHRGEKCGIRIRLTEEDIEIDLSDDAITDLLMQHLQPRYRAVMEGVVR